MSLAVWYSERPALRFVFVRFLPLFAGLSLAWELGQVRLYTIWEEASAAYLGLAILHCTVGDLIIGTAALLLALVVGRERALVPLAALWLARRGIEAA